MPGTFTPDRWPGTPLQRCAGETLDLVAVLSPMHQPYYEPLLTTAHAAYSTPLGQVPVDTKTIADLDSHLKESLGYGWHRWLTTRNIPSKSSCPFLQRALGADFKLLPVMVRAQSAQVSKQLGAALAETLRGRNALLVASTDLSHFYTQTEALSFDTEMLRRIESFSPEDVFCAEEEAEGLCLRPGRAGRGIVGCQRPGRRHGQGAAPCHLRRRDRGLQPVVGYGAAVVMKTR